MTDFIKRTRDDGLIEYVHPNHDEIIAKAEAEEAANHEPIEITEEQMAADNLFSLRRIRNQKLAETDWWSNSDLTMTQEQKDYREALRDITNNYNSLEEVVWPVKP
jgi:hypothetical protein|tara:strand:+ start:536 stop:853 length:318 start_codon:yes stop_codon:yes gene_type:complete